MDNLQDNMKLVDMLEQDETVNADGVDFNWWDDLSLLTFALDFDKTKMLNEDNMQSLIYELARRLDDYVNGEETDED